MRKLSLIVLLLFTFTSLLFTFSFSQIPHLINYQGKLTDTSGNPVADGTHSITFRIYDAESAGILLWQETQNLLISKGIFSCLLGGVTELNLLFDKPYWLAVKVGSDSEMTPRQQIASVGYAMRAENVENANKLDGQDSSYYLDLTNASGNLAVSRLNSGVNASSSTYWRGDGNWAYPPRVTQASDTDSGTDFSRESEVQFLTVTKNITNGNVVFLNASGTLYNGSGTATLRLKCNSTNVQIVRLDISPTQYGGYGWSLSGIVTGLSGNVTFSVTAVADGAAGFVKGNLQVLEF